MRHRGSMQKSYVLIGSLRMLRKEKMFQLMIVNNFLKLKNNSSTVLISPANAKLYI